MESTAEGLWGLADWHETRGEVGKAVKCLEAICQTSVSFLPIIDIKTRLRIATLLLNHTHNVLHAFATEGVHCTKVPDIPDASDVWGGYKDQRHDLFLPSNAQSAAAAGVVGLIESSSSRLTDALPAPPHSSSSRPIFAASEMNGNYDQRPRH